jgi:hypothetical protein
MEGATMLAMIFFMIKAIIALFIMFWIALGFINILSWVIGLIMDRRE